MAKKKLVVSLAPIKIQIKKAEQSLRKLKPKVSVAGKKQIDLNIKELQGALALLTKGCKGIMTHAFQPAEDDE
jgi:hypothetical protein